MIYPERARLVGFRQDVPQARQRHEARGFRRRTSARSSTGSSSSPTSTPIAIMITGGSYGGYMTLACAVHFADRISRLGRRRRHLQLRDVPRAHRELPPRPAPRRVRRRARSRDARVPREDRAAQQRRQDHQAALRGPGQERPARALHARREQIVARRCKKRGTPVWFLLAKDEGHGFAKKPNADFQFYATVEFARQTLPEVT